VETRINQNPVREDARPQRQTKDDPEPFRGNHNLDVPMSPNPAPEYVPPLHQIRKYQEHVRDGVPTDQNPVPENARPRLQTKEPPQPIRDSHNLDVPIHPNQVPEYSLRVLAPVRLLVFLHP
jgi:hypothetical protein